jgi:hypothetical protein
VIDTGRSKVKENLMSSAATKGLLVALLCLALFPRTAGAADPTADEARAAIEAIEKDPLAAEKAGHVGTVMTFAELSPDVMVMLDRELLPTIGDKTTPHAGLLNAAFVGGNVRAQLDAKKNKDDSYAGLQMLFKVYRAIQAAEKDFKVESIEKLEALDKEGKLKDKVAQVQKRHGQ